MWCQNVSPKEFRVPPSALNPCQNQKGQCPPLLAAVIMKGSIIKMPCQQYQLTSPSCPSHASTVLTGGRVSPRYLVILPRPPVISLMYSVIPSLLKAPRNTEYTFRRELRPTRACTNGYIHGTVAWHMWMDGLPGIQNLPRPGSVPNLGFVLLQSTPSCIHSVALTSLAYTTNQGHTNQPPTIPTRMVSACSAQQCPGVLQCSHCVQLLCCPGYGGGMPPCRAACLHRHQTHPDPSPKIGKYNQTRASPRPPVRQRMAFT